MYEILNNITERVRRVLSKDYSHETGDFKRGFRYCSTLYSIGIDRSAGELKRANIRYNQGQRIKELEREVDNLSYKLKRMEEMWVNRPSHIDLEDDRMIHSINSIAKYISKRFEVNKKEEREVIKDIFKRYV